MTMSANSVAVLSLILLTWLELGEATGRQAYLETATQDELVEQLNDALWNKDYSRALATLEKLLLIEPDNPQLHNLIGTTKEKAGRFAEATASYSRALELQPSSSLLGLNLALNYLRLERYSDAAREFGTLIDQEGSTAPPPPNYYQRAPVGSELEKFARALRPEEIQYSSLARVFIRNHIPQAAAIILTVGTQSLPKSAELHYLLGQSVQETGQVAEAQAAFRRALQLRPDFFEACLRLGYSQHTAGEIERATETYQHCVRMNPEHYAAHYFLGANLIRGREQKLDQAIAHLETAVKLNAHSLDSRLQLGKAYVQRGSYAEALRELTIVVRENPSNEEAHYRLGMLYQKMGKADAARKHLKHVESLKANRNARERADTLIDSPHSALTEIGDTVVAFYAKFKDAFVKQRYREIWDMLTEKSKMLYDDDPESFRETLSRLHPQLVDRITRSSVAGGKLIAGRILCEFHPVDGHPIPAMVLIQDGDQLRIDYAFDLSLAGLARLGAR